MNGEFKRSASLLLVLAAAFGLALGLGVAARNARAQGDGQAGNLICVIGPANRSSELPIVLVDGREQTLMIYHYDQRSDEIELKATRSFRWDKLLREYNVEGESVSAVRRLVQKQKPED